MQARSALKKARAETRMIVRHHADKFHLPDPDYYQKRFTTLLYAARNSGFQEAEDMMAQLVHIMYKLVKLQVLYQYLYEVLQMLPTPSIHVGAGWSMLAHISVYVGSYVHIYICGCQSLPCINSQ